jgi:hypothetical protein
LGFGRFLAAKIEFSYGAVQTVNLLALRLQWFESTPTQASPRAILQVLKLLGATSYCAGFGDFWLPANRSWRESSRSLNIGVWQSKSDLFDPVGQFMEAT